MFYIKNISTVYISSVYENISRNRFLRFTIKLSICVSFSLFYSTFNILNRTRNSCIIEERDILYESRFQKIGVVNRRFIRQPIDSKEITLDFIK